MTKIYATFIMSLLYQNFIQILIFDIGYNFNIGSQDRAIVSDQLF